MSYDTDNDGWTGTNRRLTDDTAEWGRSKQ